MTKKLSSTTISELMGEMERFLDVNADDINDELFYDLNALMIQMDTNASAKEIKFLELENEASELTDRVAELEKEVKELNDSE